MQYEWYECLSTAVRAQDRQALRRCWSSVRQTASQPWTAAPGPGTPLDGHIPYDLDTRIWKRAPSVFEGRGIYLWGAWTGEAARIQYIGIADRQSVESRFRQRYAYELRLAKAHEAAFRALPDSFRPKPGDDVKRFADAGIPVRSKQPTRVRRSDRYAKIGLQNLWHFVIPVPGKPGANAAADQSLGAVEDALISLANAGLFGLNQRGAAFAFPLVNIQGASSNSDIPDGMAGQFHSWLFDGPWWVEMNRHLGVVHPA
jgi:hypothetical protein